MKSKRNTSMRSKLGNSNKNSNLSMTVRKKKQLSRKNSRKTRGSRRYQSRRQRGGFFTDSEPTRGCRGPSSIDMNSSEFQDIFRERPTEPSSLTLDDMYFSFENSEGRQRFAPL